MRDGVAALMNGELRKSNWEPWKGLFATIRVVEGTPLFAEQHLAQLLRAAEAIHIAIPDDFKPLNTVLPRKSGRWRWIITPTGFECPFAEETPAAARPDLELLVSPVRVGSANWDARFKTLSYLSHAQARELADPVEALLLNEKGHVASGATSNIFWVLDNCLYTPAHEEGCREGVVRQFLMEHGVAIAPIHVGGWPLVTLDCAQEIFLTNSIRGIMPIHRFSGRTLDSGVTTQLQAIYDDEVARQLREKAERIERMAQALIAKVQERQKSKPHDPAAEADWMFARQNRDGTWVDGDGDPL